MAAVYDRRGTRDGRSPPLQGRGIENWWLRIFDLSFKKQGIGSSITVKRKSRCI